MLRPPTSGGRGESDFHDYTDAEIPAKRGNPDDLPANDTGDTQGALPAEGRSDLSGAGVGPGADRDDLDQPGGGIGIDRDPRDIDTRDRNDDLPERLGERLENGSSSSIATGGSDVLPDVEPPDTTM